VCAVLFCIETNSTIQWNTTFEAGFGFNPITLETLSAADRGIAATGILGDGYAKAAGKGLKAGVNFFSKSKNATNANETANHRKIRHQLKEGYG